MAAALRVVRLCSRARGTVVAFIDLQHGQTGVAPNTIELHPVLESAAWDRDRKGGAVACRRRNSWPFSASRCGSIEQDQPKRKRGRLAAA
jgi:hypothetical protein